MTLRPLKSVTFFIILHLSQTHWKSNFIYNCIVAILSKIISLCSDRQKRNKWVLIKSDEEICLHKFIEIFFWVEIMKLSMYQNRHCVNKCGFWHCAGARSFAKYYKNIRTMSKFTFMCNVEFGIFQIWYFKIWGLKTYLGK